VSVPDGVAEAATSDTDPVLYEVRDTGVAVLTLNRPERMNGWGGGLDLLLSGRVFHADEAAEIGLVSEVVAPDQLLPRAIAYAEDIAANCAPSSLAVIKQQVYADSMRDVFESSAVAEKLMHESMLRPDFIEGITSFFEKRSPNFPPLKSS
jgi:enoyl-CoA hydratase/carnithine racemase